MRMVTYIARRLLLLVPVMLGVITVTFILFQALPVQDQLASHFGNPPRKHPCAFLGQCPCWYENTSYVAADGNVCTCLGSSVPTTRNATCTDPLFTRYLDKLGLNQPVTTQWAEFTWRALTLQWGTIENDTYLTTQMSFLKAVPVTTAIARMLPYTLELAALSLFLILLVSIPLGNLAAVNRNRPVDQVARVISFSGFAMPAFLLGSLVMAGVVLVLLPTTGFTIHPPWCTGGEPITYEFLGSWPGLDDPAKCYPGLTLFQQAANGGYPLWLKDGYASHPTGFPTVDAMIHGQYWLAADTILRLLLPALVIAFGSIAGILRFVRNSMLEVMNLDYVRTARAKGVPESIVAKRHAGRNSLNVTITVLGLTFAFFIGGFPIIEDVFQLNGVGRMLAYAVVIGNGGGVSYAMIFGSTILFTYLVVVANLIVDVLYGYLDPRVRLG